MTLIKNIIKALIPDNRFGRACYDWVKNRRVMIKVLEGNVKTTTDSVRVMLVGCGQEIEYLTNMIFDDAFTDSCNCTIWLWELRLRVARQRIDVLIFINPGDVVARSCKGRQVFHVPVWVRGETDFETVAVLQKKDNIRSDARRVRKHKLDYIVTTDQEAFDDFYHSMLVPSAIETHGKAAYLVNYDEFKHKASQSELLLVRKEGQVIAGEVILYDKGRARAWLVGIKDGNHDYVKLGALAACYIFSIQHLKEKNYQRVHLGSSKAFLMDGVLQYKKKWGLQLVGARRGGFLIEAIRKSTGTLSLLAKNPFIQLRNNEFTGEYFACQHEVLTASRLRAIHNACHFQGMKQLNIYRPGGTQDSIEIPAGLQDEIKFQDINALF